MLILVSAMLLAGGPVPPAIGEVFYGYNQDKIGPGSDMTLRPPKVPDYRTEEQIRTALAAKEKGEIPSCILPKAIPAARPR